MEQWNKLIKSKIYVNISYGTWWNMMEQSKNKNENKELTQSLTYARAFFKD